MNIRKPMPNFDIGFFSLLDNMQYELIGKFIAIPDDTNKQQAERAIQKVHAVFNDMARLHAHRHVGCGAIRWTWVLTLLLLRKEGIECEENLVAYSGEEEHNIHIQIGEAAFNFRTTVCSEYVLRKAARDVAIRLQNMECSGIDPDISVRQIAFDMALRLFLLDSK